MNGISSNNITALKQLYSYLISNLYEYFIFSISGSWGTSTRPQIRWKEEYLSFPLIEPDNETKIHLINLVNQFLKPYKEFYSEFNLDGFKRNEPVFDEINSIINKLYGIKNYEEDLY